MSMHGPSDFATLITACPGWRASIVQDRFRFKSEGLPVKVAPYKVVDLFFGNGMHILELVQGTELFDVEAVWRDRICKETPVATLAKMDLRTLQVRRTTC